jgi:putative N6-adenine-specific DNA methylase
LADLQNYIATTLPGLESVLAAELEALGAVNVQKGTRNVAFQGDETLLYRANYTLRCALRILLPLHTFEAPHEKALYAGVREVDWTRYMSVTDTLAIDSVVRSEVFRHSQYAGLLAKDAIVDQFRDKYQRRPNVNIQAPTLHIHLHIHGTTCHISLDSSGESLHRRNYRKDTVEAPLTEVLAAGMLQLSGWNGASDLVDPMCGSGTIAIEAAMWATQTPAQLHRPLFGFFRWPNFDKKRWEQVKAEANARIQPFEGRIFASDKDPRARNATSLNLMAAGMENYVTVEKMTFERLEPPSPVGTLLFNPPYDERLQVAEVERFYSMIGDRLKQRWSGWNAWLISSNREALKHIGLRSARKITLFNGALECSFQQFELYEGKRKD